jgi:hypothetical protein
MDEFRSHRSYRKFAWYVRTRGRYRLPTEHREFLDTLLITGAKRRQQIPKGAVLFRAQAGHDLRTEKDGEVSFDVECAFPPERMKPPTDRAFEGRANWKGIPCLYAATSAKTAIGECRPWVGALLSVSQLETSRELQILDCTGEDIGYRIYFSEPPAEEREKEVWRDVDRAFAEPVARADDTADYAPTQIIAELFRENGLDGVGYRSALGTGHNIALFDLGCAQVINGRLVRVDALDIQFRDVDGPYVVDAVCEKSNQPPDGS